MINTLFSRINITKSTEKELILQVNPVLSHLVALSFMILALLIFSFSMTINSATTLTCEKSSSKSEAITCQLLNNSFLGIKSEQEISFSNFPKAVIVRKLDQETNQTDYQAVLSTDTEEVVLAHQPSDYHYQEWQQNIIQLNKFIENINEISLIIEEKMMI